MGILDILFDEKRMPNGNLKTQPIRKPKTGMVLKSVDNMLKSRREGIDKGIQKAARSEGEVLDYHDKFKQSLEEGVADESQYGIGQSEILKKKR